MTLPEGILLGLALLPVMLGLANLPLVRRLPRHRAPGVPLSVLVPARNEGPTIADCLAAILDDAPAETEVLVFDDASEDATAEIVARLAARDPRLRLLRGQGPPPGWNGKQYACDRLGRAARHGHLLFLDADVRLEPGALRRLAAAAAGEGADLLSGFPRQETGSLLERLLIPFMHFLLLGFLPLGGTRRSRGPAFAAACGQLVLVRRGAWLAVGGHGAIRASRHDGITLPRALRRAGFGTHLVDASDLARCRMYRGAAAVWNGLAKNATEGLASPVGIWVWSALLLGGQVLPAALLPVRPSALLVAAVTAPILFRVVIALRFRHAVSGALLHPLGTVILLALQWRAWWQARRGRLPRWRGRPAIPPAR